MKNHKWLMTILLFIAFWGVFSSMLNWGFFHIFTESGFSFSFDGFVLIFNRLFEISELNQSYRYVMFNITAPQNMWSGQISAALFVFAIFFASLSFFLAFTRFKIFVLIIMIFVVGVQVYFGVFPDSGWNILLFSAFAAVISHKKGLINIAVCVLFLILPIAGISTENPRFDELSETLRDHFAVRQFSNAQEQFYDPAYQRFLYVSENIYPYANEGYDTVEYERPLGAEIGAIAHEPSMWLLLLAIFIVLLVIAIFRYLPRYIHVYKRRKMFALGEPNNAIKDMFFYLNEWLFAYGLKEQNIPFSCYESDLGLLISSEYSREYSTAVVLWQRAVFSDYLLDENDRKFMLDFLEKTMEIVWKNSNILTKIKMKFVCYL
jgi:hypothetical protein